LSGLKASYKYAYIQNGCWLNKTLNDFMRERLTDSPDRLCFVQGCNRFTFREIEFKANNLVVNLYNAGIRKGDVITCQLPDCYQMMIINLASVKLGTVFNPVAPIYKERELGFILKQSKAKVLFVSEVCGKDNYISIMKNMKSDLSSLELLIIVGDTAADGMTCYKDFERGDGAAPPEESVDPDDVKLLLYTSGTTSEPKGAQHSHNTITCTVNAIAKIQKCTRETIIFMPAPLSHMIGYLMALELPIIAGCAAVIMPDRWNAEQAIQLIEQYKCTLTGGAPRFLLQMLCSPGINEHDLSSLKHFTLGGASVPPELIYKAHAAGLNAYRAYGATEFPVVTMGDPEGTVKEKAETDGKVLNYQIRIINDDNEDVPVGESGEILIIGPGLFLGYYDSVLNAEYFEPDGWFRTGDIGSQDKEGNLTICGRKKDIIIRSGENISAREIEELLQLHHSIKEAAVVAMPDEETGEKACAYLLLNPGEKFTLEDMIAHLSNFKLAKQKYPERIELVETFPRNASGKIQKYILRKDIEDKIRNLNRYS